MKKRLIRLLFAAVAATTALPAEAQFYDNGAEPWFLRWNVTGSDSVRVVAPDNFGKGARKVLYYMDSVRPSVDYGLRHGVLRVPVVVNTLSSASNGLSIWAPKRIEMIAMPAVDCYSTPWLKQLSVHEYRHMAQYAALDRRFIRGLSYVFGQQALLLTSGLLPFWFIEGDATDAETQMSVYGRGLQPSFTMHYRALGRDILRKRNPDSWFGGSYRKHVPSHYELGYQMVTYANTVADGYAWNKAIDYAASYPFTLFPVEIALHKYGGSSTKKLFRQTFASLNDYWDSLPDTDDSARRIDGKSDRHNYTTYRYPVFLDGRRVVALKTDMDNPSRFVEIDLGTGKEKTLFHTGIVNTRPVLADGVLYWTEYSQKSFWGTQIRSVIRHANLSGAARGTVAAGDYMLYPVVMDGTLGAVRYDTDGTYAIDWGDRSFAMAEGVSVHGLAADNGNLYYIALSDDGMSIEAINVADGARSTVKQAAHVTLSDLRAEGGKLYFGSVATGLDEAHMIDLADGSEWCMTSSRYGSFSPSPRADSICLTVYDRYGYHPAVQKIERMERIEYSPVPENKVNPPRYRWQGVTNADSLRYGAAEQAQSNRQHKTRKYSKAAHLFNFHSWAPVYYRPDQLMSGTLEELHFGVMAASQNLLSSAITTLGYGYTLDGYHLANLHFVYDGFPVKIELNAHRSTRPNSYFPARGIVMRQGVYSGSYDDSSTIPAPASAPSCNAFGRIYLPVLLQHSYHTSFFTPSVELSLSNTMLYNPEDKSYSVNRGTAIASLQYSDVVRKAARDIQPRWGIAVMAASGKRAASMATPVTCGIYAKFYTPAFGRNDGFTLRFAHTDITGNGPLNYAVDFGWLVPRGSTRFTDKFVWPDNRYGASVDYVAPLWYPDAGIPGVVLLKRVRMSLFGDYLQGDKITAGPTGPQWTRSVAFSFGGNLCFDTSWFRLPQEADMALQLSCYLVGGHEDSPVFGVGVEMNF